MGATVGGPQGITEEAESIIITSLDASFFHHPHRRCARRGVDHSREAGPLEWTPRRGDAAQTGAQRHRWRLWSRPCAGAGRTGSRACTSSAAGIPARPSCPTVLPSWSPQPPTQACSRGPIRNETTSRTPFAGRAEGGHTAAGIGVIRADTREPITAAYEFAADGAHRRGAGEHQCAGRGVSRRARGVGRVRHPPLRPPWSRSPARPSATRRASRNWPTRSTPPILGSTWSPPAARAAIRALGVSWFAWPPASTCDAPPPASHATAHLA